MSSEEFFRKIIEAAWPLRDITGVNKDLLLEQFRRNLIGKGLQARVVDPGAISVGHADVGSEFMMRGHPAEFARRVFEFTQRLLCNNYSPLTHSSIEDALNMES